MSDPPSDPSVFSEPHLQARPYHADGNDPAPAGGTPATSRSDSHGITSDVQHSVWDEPALSPELAGAPPAGALTYRRWLEEHRAVAKAWVSWSVTLVVAASSGVWAVFGTLWGSGQTVWSGLALTVFGPVVEETMKIAAPLYVVESRPYLFRSSLQILLCCLASAATFAAIENVIYLKIYVPNPPTWLAQWRWTVCVALHTSCSAIAGWGVVRIWRDVWARRSSPRLALGYPYLVAGVVVHGTYNAVALVMELARF